MEAEVRKYEILAAVYFTGAMVATGLYAPIALLLFFGHASWLYHEAKKKVEQEKWNK